VALDILVQCCNIQREMEKLNASIKLYFPCFKTFPDCIRIVAMSTYKLVNAHNCTLNYSTGYSFLLFNRHPCLPIELIFELDHSLPYRIHKVMEGCDRGGICYGTGIIFGVGRTE